MKAILLIMNAMIKTVNPPYPSQLEILAGVIKNSLPNSFPLGKPAGRLPYINY